MGAPEPAAAPAGAAADLSAARGGGEGGGGGSGKGPAASAASTAGPIADTLTVTTVAGFANYSKFDSIRIGSGFADGACATAEFNCPQALAPLPDGSIVVADAWNHCVRLIAAGGGGVTTLAGRGGKMGCSAGGPAAEARLSIPRGVAVGADGAIFVADTDNRRILCIKSGAVNVFAGSGEQGGADGVGAAASFHGPHGLALGPGGALYLAEDMGNRIRVISPAGAVVTLAGGSGGESGFADGKGTAARFHCPRGIAVDAAGVVFVADTANHRIRRITNGVVDTLAGSGQAGFSDGVGAAALFNQPSGLAVDPRTGNLIVADHNRIRAVDIRSGAVCTLAGSGTSGLDDGAAAAARFRQPGGVAVDAHGDILVADTGNQCVRRIVRATPGGALARGAAGGGSDGGGGSGGAGGASAFVAPPRALAPAGLAAAPLFALPAFGAAPQPPTAAPLFALPAFGAAPQPPAAAAPAFAAAHAFAAATPPAAAFGSYAGAAASAASDADAALLAALRRQQAALLALEARVSRLEARL